MQDRPRSGIPRITTDRVDRSIRLETLRNRLITARSLQMRYIGRHGRHVMVSVQTIKNRLHASQLKSRKAAQKPLLRVAVFFLCFPSPWPHKTGSVGRNKIKKIKMCILIYNQGNIRLHVDIFIKYGQPLDASTVQGF